MSEIGHIEVYGARVHNLRNLNLRLPREQMVVITGISGSGKSSLAFDTIYAEGQRRYLESFSAYARSFIGQLERPDVDKIDGLSPVIAIEQKTTSRNPRSTVGTLTEIYDYLRVLYARAGTAYSYKNGNPMIRQNETEIKALIRERLDGQAVTILAPVVKGRKGHYRELFLQMRKSGYTRVRIDGELQEMGPKMQLDRYKVHDIEVVIDRIKVDEKGHARLAASIDTALKVGKGSVYVIDEQQQLHFFSKHLMDPESGVAYEDPAPNLFSFNSPYGACPSCNGLGIIQAFTKESLIPDQSLSISRGAIAALGEYRDIGLFRDLQAALKKLGHQITTPLDQMPEEVLDKILNGSKGYEGVIPMLRRFFENGSDWALDLAKDYMETGECPECHGQRLRQEALHFRLEDKNISALAGMDLAELADWLEGLEDRLGGIAGKIATEPLKEVRKRLRFLLDVGLEYLTLNRPLRTLSGGEAQRIRLATQIGTQLVGVLYILDEPSIGLHQRDNQRLIDSLKALRDLGNTVLVVEHDRDMMVAADYLVDIGPGAGRNGGQIMAAGLPAEVMAQDTLTAGYLRGEIDTPMPDHRRAGNGNELVLRGAKGHNLRDLTVRFPLGKFIAVTGVSGSGKSSLIHGTLHPALSTHFYRSKREPLPYDQIEGIEQLDKVIEVDQSPIGRTPRSNPATYTGVFSDIRSLFAQLPEAKIRGYKPGRFSFNVKGGRCETCQGGGMQVIEMDFLPDVQVECPECRGKRYNRQTLEVRYKGKSIADVLDMRVDDAVEFFTAHPSISRKLALLHEVGLGYITLGQHATTLSGGEAQRVKLATELSKRDTGQTLYILDEPTTGLHFQDIAHLLDVLQKLVDRGNTVLVIEHNLDVVKAADWVIDMGPEGGRGGGYLLAEGTPEDIAAILESHTGRFLAQELARSRVSAGA